MRRSNLLLATLLIFSMLLAACGGEETSTTVPSTNVPPVTAEFTMTEDASMLTGTPEATAAAGTTTPGVPVTGEDNTSRVSNLLDYDVWNQNGEQIGEVEDMVLDMDSSNVSYVVIETGGFLDLGDKTLLVPWNSFELQTPVNGGNENGFVLTVDPEMLDNAPDMDLSSMLPPRGEPANGWDVDIRNFWESGVMPDAVEATATTTTGEATAAPEMTATTTTGAATDAGTGTGTTQNELQGVMLATEVIGSTITIGQGQAQGQGTGQTTVETTATVDPSVSPAVTPEATSSSGTGVGTGNRAPTEATIEDIIVDPNTGDIAFLVLSSLFDGEDRWIPVPLSTLRWDTANESFLFVPDASALQNAPFFLPDEFPDTGTEGWDTEFNVFWQNN